LAILNIISTMIISSLIDVSSVDVGTDYHSIIDIHIEYRR